MAGEILNIANFTPRRLTGRVRRVDQAEVRALDEANQSWLRPLNLRVVGVREVQVVGEVRNLNGVGRGVIQDTLRPHLELAGAVSALAPQFYGRNRAGLVGDPAVWEKGSVKQLIDRGAASIQGWAFEEIMGLVHEYFARVAASEGGRIKPGREDEAGGNPATYLEQVFSTGEIPLSIVIDNVDKTGATVDGLHSAVTAFLFTASRAKAIPDLRFLKLVSGRGFTPDITDINADPKAVAEAMANTWGIRVDQLNLTNLVIGREKRLGEPTEAFLKMMIDFISDKDGDVMSAIAAALGAYALHKGQPLHGMAAAAGGAAEGGLLLPVEWLGGKVLLAFASASGFKTWPTRKSFVGTEEADIQEAGFTPWGTILMQDIYDNPFADGTAVYGDIAFNRWIPDLKGADAGINMAVASALSIVPQGFARIRIFDLDYVDPSRAATAAAFMPPIYHLRTLGSAGAIKDQVAAWMKNRLAKTRLERDWRQDYYVVLDPYLQGGVLQGHAVDRTAFDAQMRGKKARYDERDLAILAALQQYTPWIVGEDAIRMSKFVDFGQRGADDDHEFHAQQVFGEG